MTEPLMDIHQILEQLPHRYPFVLVDRVLEIEPGKKIKAVKNVSINESEASVYGNEQSSKWKTAAIILWVVA